VTLATSPGTVEKTAACIASVLPVPVALIMPDAVMVALPWMGWRNSAETRLPPVTVTAALFASKVAGLPVPPAVPVLTATAWSMVLGVTLTTTPGASVTLVGVPVLPTLMPVVYSVGGLAPGAQIVLPGGPEHCASAGDRPASNAATVTTRTVSEALPSS
jgi:hypothetical protein